ncbi:MAG: hypothetical protein M4579_002627 [Chaenotheca gracillima]|nr:MAG: hypothetical protein M4579_002627 [Chaenotheca gracillima]
MIRQTVQVSRQMLRCSSRSTNVRTFSQCSPVRAWEGRKPEEHVTNQEHDLNIQSSASRSGKTDRSKGNEQQQAAAQKDSGNNNERAKKDHPEAPSPVIGMNDERGGKGH